MSPLTVVYHLMLPPLLDLFASLLASLSAWLTWLVLWLQSTIVPGAVAEWLASSAPNLWTRVQSPVPPC